MSKLKNAKKTPTSKGAKAKGDPTAAPATPETLKEVTAGEAPAEAPVATPVANNEGEGTAPAVVVAQLQSPAPAKKPKAKAAKPAKAETAKSANTETAKPSKGETTKLSALDAAAKVLADTGEPMTTKSMIETMAAKKLWTSPGGKTPAATLYSAILREITVKGKESRFRKADRGLFAFAG